MSAAANQALAHAWIDAFNAHDVPRLVALYAEACTHTSPKLRAAGGEGCIRGKAALTTWWQGAMNAMPSLRYELLTVTASEARVFIEYTRHCDGQAPMAIAEVFDVAGGHIVASRVFHG